jgi:hypothetical protein
VRDKPSASPSAAAPAAAPSTSATTMPATGIPQPKGAPVQPSC